MWYILLMYILLSRPPDVASVLHAPNTDTEPYIREGDLNIGGMYSVRARASDMTYPCGAPVTSFRLQQNIEAMVYAIYNINKDPDILPGVNLGYVILDDCRRSVTALSQAVRFAKPYQCAYQTCEDQYANATNRPHYEVVGVVGPTSSSRGIAISSLLSLHHIPIVSPEATGDDLSDKYDHAYFLRVIPPDKFQAAAIAEIVIHFNWTYVSLLYVADATGTKIAKVVRRRIKDKGICLGYQQSLEDDLSDEKEYDRTVANLQKYGNARAVILALTIGQSRNLLAAIRRAGISGHFIWIGSEAFDVRVFQGYEQEANGALSFSVPLGYDAGFVRHYLTVNPHTNPGNPWYRELWQNLFKCSWATNSTDETSCLHHTSVAAADGFFISNWTSLTEDAVWTFAHALHALVEDNCKQHVGDKEKLRQCVTGPQLLAYLKNVSFQGLTAHISFDDNGDIIGNYIVKQLVREGSTYIHQDIGEWQQTAGGGRIQLDESKLSWTNMDLQITNEVLLLLTLLFDFFLNYHICLLYR